MLNTWKEGEATEESFITLVQENSDDSNATTGGLFEDINNDSGYVTEFQDWALDPKRVAGETDIIETQFGYHIMYYVGDDELTYRDYLIENELRSQAMTEWYSPIVSETVFSLKNTKRLHLSVILSEY